jgi:hypothetical protein
MDWIRDWIPFISAFGLGAIVIKILDITWLQKVNRDAEKSKWLRDNRLRVYSKLTEELLSLGKALGTREDAFKGYSIASEAILLAPSDELAREIEVFFTMQANLFREACIPEDAPSHRSEEELENAYQLVVTKSRKLVYDLRKSLRES